MITAINYADKSFSKDQKFNLETAKKWGAEKLDIMIFSLENDMLEKKYTKRDTFILMGCDTPEYTDTLQSIGGYVIYKKFKFVEKFLAEDLEYAQDIIIIISENENTQGKNNYPVFVAHRHDQSVWSLMSKNII